MRDGARRGRRLVAVAAFALVALTALPAPAAEDVTAATLRELAARAERDPGARQELAKVRRVDGRPVDLATALRGGSEDEQRSRLRTLARGAPGSGAAPSAAAARDDARRILDSRRFKPAKTPRPFRGVLRKLAEWLRPVTRPLGRLWVNITQPRLGMALPAGVLLAVCVVVAVRMVRRRTEAALGGPGGSRHRRHGLDPDALDQQAATAEADGDYDTALRLRFRAGLLRLDAAGAVKLRPSLTTGELTRRVRSAELHELAATFEAVAYAGEHADAEDVAAARSRWPRVLEQAGRR